MTTPEPTLDLDVTLTVSFTVKDAAALAALQDMARVIDVETGVHPDDLPAAYTPAQAVQVVLHGEPERLFPQLTGWVVQDQVWDTPT